MAYGVNDIVYHINSLKGRVSDLETVVFEDTAAEENADSLKITNITRVVEYKNPTPEGVFTAEVVWSWAGPPAPDPDDLNADPVVDYFVSVSTLGVSELTSYYSTRGTTTFTSTQPINSTSIFRVYAVTKKGSKGPVATSTLVVVKGAWKPNQPSIPVLEPATGAVLVKHNGKDVYDAPYGTEVRRIEVHYNYGGNFTPSSSTLFTVVPVGGSTSIGANADYGDITVRFVAVDNAGTVSNPGGYSTAKPKKVVESDMGIPVVQGLPYTQYDNLLANGSFEDDQLTAWAGTLADTRLTVVSNTSIAYHGNKFLRYKGDARTSSAYAWMNQSNYGGPTGLVMLNKDYSYRAVAQVRTLSWDNGGEVAVMCEVTRVDGTKVTLGSSLTTAAPDWTAAAFTIPKNEYVQARFFVRFVGLPTAEVLIDAYHCTHIVGSSLIENAAIGTAHIENLAVNDAKIAGVQAGKILAGQIAAEQYIAAGPQEGIHARLSPEGFSAYNFDDDGNLYKSTRLGSDINSLVIQASNNIPVLDVNSDTLEVNAFSFGTSPAGVTSIYGTEFNEHLGNLDKTVAFGRIENLGVYAYNGSVAQPYMEVQAYLEAGFTYKLVLSGVKFNMGNTNSSYVTAKALQVQVRYSTGTTPVTTSSTLLFSQNATTDITYYGADGGFGDTYLFKPTVTGDHNFLVGYQVLSQATAQSISARLYGAALEVVRVSELDNTGFFREPNVVPVVVRQYTSEWVASDSATYTGSGTKRTDTKNVRQGSGNSSYGDQYSIAVFNSGALSGETGKTVAQALTGNVTIQKVEVAVYCNFTYYYNGGFFQVSANPYTTITNTVPNTTKKQFSASKGKVIWVDITSIFNTSHRGIWIGKGGSNLNQYTWFNGHQESNPPRLKITYTRRT